MKVEFEILYRSGHIDKFVQEGKQEEFENINNSISLGFRENTNNVLRFGDRGMIERVVRLSSIDRVRMTLL